MGVSTSQNTVILSPQLQTYIQLHLFMTLYRFVKINTSKTQVLIFSFKVYSSPGLVRSILLFKSKTLETSLISYTLHQIPQVFWLYFHFSLFHYHHPCPPSSLTWTTELVYHPGLHLTLSHPSPRSSWSNLINKTLNNYSLFPPQPPLQDYQSSTINFFWPQEETKTSKFKKVKLSVETHQCLLTSVPGKADKELMDDFLVKKLTYRKIFQPVEVYVHRNKRQKTTKNLKHGRFGGERP